MTTQRSEGRMRRTPPPLPRRTWRAWSAAVANSALRCRNMPRALALLAIASMLSACTFFARPSPELRPIACDSAHMTPCDRRTPDLGTGKRTDVLRATEQIRAQRDECAIRHAGLIKCVKEFNDVDGRSEESPGR